MSFKFNEEFQEFLIPFQINPQKNPILFQSHQIDNLNLKTYLADSLQRMVNWVNITTTLKNYEINLKT